MIAVLESATNGTVVEPAPVERRVVMDAKSGRVAVVFEFDPKLVAQMKEIPTARWDGAAKVWTVAPKIEVLRRLAKFTKPNGFTVDATMVETWKRLVEEARGNHVASKAWSPTGVIALNGMEELRLYPFQVAAVEYAARVIQPGHGMLLCDEMGLGKTVESLAILRNFEAFPAVVVCPASLKFNWEREIGRWLPGKTVTVLEGKKLSKRARRKTNALRRVAGWKEKERAEDLQAIEDSEPAMPALADVYVVNYDILGDHVDTLKEACNASAKEAGRGVHGLQGLIFDEGHYLRNGLSKRFAAAKKLARGVPIRLVVSGTPMVNAPKDLVAPLGLIGRLNDVGGFWEIAHRYCGARVVQVDRKEPMCQKARQIFAIAKQQARELTLEEKRELAALPGWRWDMSGARNLPELGATLRRTCFFRRKKKDVLSELPPKHRAVIPLELSNRKEYDDAREDVLRWVAEKAAKDTEFRALISCMDEEAQFAMVCRRAQQAAERAQTAEELVKMSALRQIAAKGKLEAAREWIDNFIETGEHLLVGCVHRETVDFLRKEFDCSTITGDTNLNDRKQTVDWFQHGESRDGRGKLLVGNLQACGTGLTLTAASNVAVLEMGWTPAVMDQFEDRVHRIGQRNAVTAWYLMARRTVDWMMWEIVEKKRKISGEITG